MDGVATYNEAKREAALFLVNRHTSEAASVEVKLQSSDDARVIDALAMAEDDPHACNTREEMERVVPRPVGVVSTGDGRLLLAMPPASWAMVRVALSAG